MQKPRPLHVPSWLRQGLGLFLFAVAALAIISINIVSVEPGRSLQLEHVNDYQDSNDGGLKVGLCVITSEGERYLDEWVDYNFAIGFHRIYIYDNTDDNDLRKWGEISQKMGRKVHVVHFPGRGKQKLAYNECTKTFGNLSDYLAYFDDDEFLVLKKHQGVSGLVRDHLPNGSLAIHWRIFGTSNHSLYSPLPVTKRYQYRLNGTFYLVKSIVRVQDYSHARTVHSFELKNGTYQRDTSGSTKFTNLGNKGVTRSDDVAVLHHYKYKSIKEYNLKSCERGTVHTKWEKDWKQNCGQDPSIGDVHDDGAWMVLKTRVPKYAAFDHWTDYS